MTKISLPKTIYYYYLMPGIIGLLMGISTTYAIYSYWSSLPMGILPPDYTTELTIILGFTSLNLICLAKIYRSIWHQSPESQRLRTKNHDAEESDHLNQGWQQELLNRKHVADQLRLSEHWLTGILDIAGDAIVSLDKTQKIILFNQFAEKIFGYSAAEIIGQPLDLLLPDRFVQIHRQHVSGFDQGTMASRKMGNRQEIFGRRKDGSEFAAEASISRLNLDGEVIYTVILRDVNERKQLENMKDEFIAVVSHELRTPVTSLHGVLNLLVSGLVDVSSEKGQQLLKIAARSTDRLVHLINDIVDIEKIYTAPSELLLTSCPVKALLEEAMQSLQPYAHETGIKLSLDITDEGTPLIILANHDQLVHVLINLINNAIQFSPPNGIVRLAAELCGSQVRFCVRDQGQGIPLEKQEMVFERFQQVDSSITRHHEGAGLGLTICRRIVHQHQGEIWLKSTVGQGSIFYFTIPAVPASSTV
jgi:PAS domain S-box-containing protein